MYHTRDAIAEDTFSLLRRILEGFRFGKSGSDDNDDAEEYRSTCVAVRIIYTRKERTEPYLYDFFFFFLYYRDNACIQWDRDIIYMMDAAATRYNGLSTHIQ